jgi:hypothetical protein
MNNLLTYCGLVDAKIRAFDKDLPVHVGLKKILLQEIFYHFFISFFDSFSWTQVGSPREFTPIFVKKHLTKWIASIQYSGFRSQAVRARFEQHISNNVAHLFYFILFYFFIILFSFFLELKTV